MAVSQGLAFGLVLVIFYLIFRGIRPRASSTKPPLPPGPPPDPIIGHLRRMMRFDDDAMFHDLYRQYGRISFSWFLYTFVDAVV